MDSTESDVRALLESQAEAMRTKDIDRLMALYSPDIIYYDTVPPLQFAGSAALKGRFLQWFDGWQGPFEMDISDLHIWTSGEIAVACRFSRARGTLKNGQAAGAWVRATSCCQRLNRTWLITHEHVSGGGSLVLVDDELSTGRTAVNTITALHALAPHERYVLAALVDLRDTADREKIAAYAAELGARIDVVSLARGAVELPAGFADLAARTVAAADPPLPARPAGDVLRHPDHWPPDVREGGRHGFGPADVRAARTAAGAVAAALAPLLRRSTLVLGTEELMYAPTLIAVELAGHGVDVRVSATTRSPVFAVDAPDYPIRSTLPFDGTDGEVALCVQRDRLRRDRPGDRRRERGTRRRAAHRLQLRARRGAADARPLPAPLRGPEFGSYRADEVAWLLTDLSDVALEAPIEEREEAIQSGGAHYAESLPVEYQPDAEYRGCSTRRWTARPTGSRTRSAWSPSWCWPNGGRTGAGLAGPGRDAGRHPDAPLGAVRARPRPAALRRQHRPRPRHRPGRAALSRRAPRPGRRGVRRRLDRQGRDRPRTCRRGRPANADWRRLRARLAVLADPGSCVDTFGTRDGLPGPVGLPELDGVRSGVPDRAEPTGPRARAVPRREVLPRTRRRGRVDAVPGRGQRRFARSPAGRPDWPLPPDRGPGADLGRLGRGRADQRAVRHRRREPGQAGRGGDDAGAAAPGAVGGAGPRRRRAPSSRTCGCSPSSAASRSTRSPGWPTAASG